MLRLHSILRFLAYSHLIIAACAVLMTMHSMCAFGGQSFDRALLIFVGSATLFVYGFHALVKKDIDIPSDKSAWTKRNSASIKWLTAASGVLAIGSLSMARVEPTILFSVAALTVAYLTAIRPGRLRAGAIGRYKSLLLAVAWTMATALLPSRPTQGAWDPSFMLFVLQRFLLVYAVCLLFDHRDRDTDASVGTRTLPVRWSAAAFRLHLFAVVSTYTAVAVFDALSRPSGGTWVASLATGVLLAAAIPRALREKDGLFHYTVLDGLMALPSLAWLASGC